jgi:4-hydroxybenzoyl-CoA thioesterase
MCRHWIVKQKGLNVTETVSAGDVGQHGDLGRDEAVHRFLVRSGDTGYVGFVDGGRLLEWIDKVGFEVAARWSRRYCVTAYVGGLHLERPISTGELVELHAQVVHTGTSSIHVIVTVRSGDPAQTMHVQRAQCLAVFVAVDESGRSVAVPAWTPTSILDLQRNKQARQRIRLRKDIEAELAAVSYSEAGTAPRMVLRFMAAPTDINWGGNAHGGRIMRWIDEAAYVCAARYSGGAAIASFFHGVRFYQPVHIGQVVDVEARLLYTRRYSMHFGVHVRAADTDADRSRLAAHALAVFSGLGDDGKRVVPQWDPVSGEDLALRQHAERLIALRSQAGAFTSPTCGP